MFAFRAETGPPPAATVVAFRVAPPSASSATLVLSAAAPLTPRPLPPEASMLPPQLSSNSTIHQPPAFLPTTVPKRPVSRRRMRDPTEISTSFAGVDAADTDVDAPFPPVRTPTGGGRLSAADIDDVVSAPFAPIFERLARRYSAPRERRNPIPRSIGTDRSARRCCDDASRGTRGSGGLSRSKPWWLLVVVQPPLYLFTTLV